MKSTKSKKRATTKTTSRKKVAKKKAPAKKKAVARKKAPASKRKIAAKKTVVKKTAAPKKKAPAKKAVVKKKAAPKKKAPARKTTAARKASPPTAKKAAKRKKGLTAAKRRKTREVLIEMRLRLTNQVASLRDDSLRRDDSGNIEEEGTDAFERQFALNLASSEQSSIVAIDDALRRLAEGNYGTCEDCGDNIELPRLDALPFVRTCIACQSEKEKTLRRRRAF